MKDCIDVVAVIKRLNRIEGQVRGIVRMIEKDKPCEDILIQIGSIKAALHKAGQLVMEGHLSHCMSEGIEAKNGDEAMKRLLKAFNQYAKIT